MRVVGVIELFNTPIIEENGSIYLKHNNRVFVAKARNYKE